jgi:guanylate kinase
MKKTGSLIVISGPSGVGKSTLIGKVRANMPDLEFSISCTTRAPRTGEIHGREYYFLSEEEFLRREANNEFIETAGVFAHRYGTLKSEVMTRLLAGKSVLLDIDVQGALSIRKAAEADPELAACAAFILIAPPDLPSLEKRLRSRATDAEEQIIRRLGAAQKELSFFRTYDYLVVNDELEKAAWELEALLKCLQMRTSLITEDPFK